MSTNNQLSGQAQEDVKTASDIHVTHKLPSEVEQRFDDGFIEEVQLNEYGDWDVLLKNEPDKMYKFIATEQVALLTRVLGLIEKMKMNVNESEINYYEDEDVAKRILERNRNTNKLLDKVIAQVQTIIEEYEV